MAENIEKWSIIQEMMVNTEQMKESAQRIADLLESCEEELCYECGDLEEVFALVRKCRAECIDVIDEYADTNIGHLRAIGDVFGFAGVEESEIHPELG